MKHIVILVLLISSAFAVLPTGWGDFRFYMDDNAIKDVITEKKYIADGKEVIEFVDDIYNYFHVKHMFTFYSPYEGSYYNFNFTDKIRELKDVAPKEIYHLTQINAKDFKVIKCILFRLL